MLSSALLRVSALSALLGFSPFAVSAQQATTQQSTGDPVADAARKARAERLEPARKAKAKNGRKGGK